MLHKRFEVEGNDRYFYHNIYIYIDNSVLCLEHKIETLDSCCESGNGFETYLIEGYAEVKRYIEGESLDIDLEEIVPLEEGIADYIVENYLDDKIYWIVENGFSKQERKDLIEKVVLEILEEFDFKEVQE